MERVLCPDSTFGTVDRHTLSRSVTRIINKYGSEIRSLDEQILANSRELSANISVIRAKVQASEKNKAVLERRRETAILDKEKWQAFCSFVFTP